MSNKSEFLTQVPLFRDFSKKEMSLLAKIMQTRKYNKDSIILSKGEIGDSLFIIISGQVKVGILSKDGREITFSFITPNDFFGEMAILDRKKRSADISTVGDTEVAVLRGADFISLLKKHPQMAIKVISILSRRLRFADEQIESLGFFDVSRRLTKKLSQLTEEFGKKRKEGILIDLPLTHQELANLVGTSRETITRILNHFKKRGLIKVEKRKIIILNQKELTKYCTFE